MTQERKKKEGEKPRRSCGLVETASQQDVSTMPRKGEKKMKGGFFFFNEDPVLGRLVNVAKVTFWFLVLINVLVSEFVCRCRREGVWDKVDYFRAKNYWPVRFMFASGEKCL